MVEIQGSTIQKPEGQSQLPEPVQQIRGCRNQSIDATFEVPGRQIEVKQSTIQSITARPLQNSRDSNQSLLNDKDQ